MHYIQNHKLQSCTICTILFSSETNRITHEHNFHYPLKCLNCNEEFFDWDILKNHYKLKHDAKLCDFCPSLIQPIDQYLIHLKKKHVFNFEYDEIYEKPIEIFKINRNALLFECFICTKEKKISEMFGHYIFYHNMTINSFNEYTSRYTDIIQIKGATTETLNNAEKCEICKNEFNENAPSLLHDIYCKGFIACIECDSIFSDSNSLKTHKIKKHGEVSCKYGCEIKLNLDDLPTHIKSIHDITSCILCGIVLSSCNNKLKFHLQEQHNVEPQLYDKICDNDKLYRLEESESKKVFCNFCDNDITKTMNDLCNVISHYELDHKAKKKIVLKKLEKNPIQEKLKPKINLNLNEKNKILLNFEKTSSIINFDINSNKLEDYDTSLIDCIVTDTSQDECTTDDESKSIEKNFICKICYKKSKTKRSLYYHHKAIHGFSTDNYQLKCNLCKIKFSTKATLRVHNKNKHVPVTSDNIKGYYECPICNINSKTKKLIRQHLRTHNEIYELKCTNEFLGYKCKFCDDNFWTIDDRNLHNLQMHPHEYMICHLCNCLWSSKVSYNIIILTISFFIIFFIILDITPKTLQRYALRSN